MIWGIPRSKGGIVIRKYFLLIMCILFSIVILVGCTKTTEIVTLPPPPTYAQVSATKTPLKPTVTQVPATKTLPPPADTPAMLTQTLEPSPTASSINELPMTERVSVASDGMQANNDSERSSISADGRYVAFSSSADNLVEDDTNGVQDVFVHDRVTGETTRVSVASDGTQANGACATIGCWCIRSGLSISADGRYVAFHSDATNLVEGDTNGFTDIFVHDRLTGETTVVSVSSDGTQGNGGSSIPSISADGRYVAFRSDATNLVKGVTNGGIFVHDRVTGETTLVSVSSDGTQGNEGAGFPAISADGQHVAFSSISDNLVEGDTNGVSDCFVHDRMTGETTRVSVASDGTQGNSDSGETPAISADGRYVAFFSGADNLVEGDTNEGADWFVHDRVTGETTLALAPINNEQPQGKYGYLFSTVSADGRCWTFISDASNLVEGDTNGVSDVFVRCLGTSKYSTVITSENAHQVTQLTSLGTLNEQMGPGELAFSPNGEILAVGYSEGPVQLYNVLSLKLLAELETDIGFVNSISFSPDGKLLAAGGGQYGPVVERGVQIWDVATQQQVLKLDDFNESVLTVRFSPDGSTLATGWGNPWGFGPGSVKIWNIATGELQAEFGLPSELAPTVCWTVFEVAFNPDGTLLAAINGNGKVQLWDIANQKEEAVINVVAGYGFGVAFSPDGKLLAASGSADRHSNVIPDLRLFDVATGELLFRLEGHEFGPDVAFSPNGQVLASSSWDGTVRLWDVETGKALAILDVPNVAYFAFNPDGTLLSTGGDILRLWGVPAH
jgi:WD40 repeat protein